MSDKKSPFDLTAHTEPMPYSGILGSYDMGAPLGLLHGIPRRRPSPFEMSFFHQRPEVAGMAAEDDAVVLNPFSKLSEKEQEAVALNEAARVHMRRGNQPEFDITDEQRGNLRGTDYENNIPAARQTIAARLLSGDPSGGSATPQQIEYLRYLRTLMGAR